MPTFDFQCRSCGAVFPFTRPFGSRKHPSCPACKGKRTEKLIAPPAIHFRGTGFYKTDSRPAPEKPAKKTEEKPAKAQSDAKEKSAKAEEKKV